MEIWVWKCKYIKYVISMHKGFNYPHSCQITNTMNNVSDTLHISLKCINLMKTPMLCKASLIVYNNVFTRKLFLWDLFVILLILFLLRKTCPEKKIPMQGNLDHVENDGFMWMKGMFKWRSEKGCRFWLFIIFLSFQRI